MKVTVEKTDDINMIFSGTIANNFIEDRFAQLKKQKIDTSDEKIQEEVESKILQEFIDEGIKEANIDVANVLGQPGFRKYEKQGESIYYEVELSITPEINVNLDYTNVIPSYTRPRVASKDINARLLVIAKQQAPFTKITQARTLQNGDIALIDFEGFIDSKTFEGGSTKNFKLKIGSNAFISGFEEQLIGMVEHEERSIKVRFSKDYISTDLADKEANFTVKLHEIQEQKPLQVDDTFARKILGDSNATLDSLKGLLQTQLEDESLSALYRNELKPKIIEGLLSTFHFTLPNNIVEQEIDTRVHALLGQLSEEELALQKDDKKKFHQLRDSVKDEAQNAVKIALIVEALASKKGVKVNEEEVVTALNYQATMTNQDPKELIKYHQENNLMTSVKSKLLQDKLFRQLLQLEG